MLKRTLGLLVLTALAACDPAQPGPPGPPDVPPAPGLFDASPLLPALSASDADAWHWVHDDGMRCRDGSATGFGLRRVEGSRRLLVYLQGGGACFDLLSCANNANAFSEGAFQGVATGFGQRGIFDQEPATNPFRDWNAVIVPYCTGDLHAGHAPDRLVPGLEVFGAQQFVGAANLQAVIGRLGPAARAADRVVLTGESAGGLGSVLTYGQVSRDLAPAPVDLLNDSGPFPPLNGALPPARQQQWSALWTLGPSLPADCDACAQPDGFEHILPHYAAAHPDRAFGLIAFREDAVLRLYYGYYGVIEAPTFEAGLLGIPPTLPENGRMYLLPGTGHTILSSPAFYTAAVGGIGLADWVAHLLDGTADHVPAP